MYEKRPNQGTCPAASAYRKGWPHRALLGGVSYNGSRLRRRLPAPSAEPGQGRLGRRSCARCEAATVRSFILVLSALHLAHPAPAGSVLKISILTQSLTAKAGQGHGHPTPYTDPGNRQTLGTQHLSWQTESTDTGNSRKSGKPKPKPS